ncbi:MAG: TonB-dependent receptor [Parvularculaceae bacterium]|nr:TonB-dependent receptor [Parvularculaceae bacterium]
MKLTKKSNWLLQSSLLAAVAATALPAAALAQDDEDEGDVIRVTGSLIQRDGNLVETSPVTTVSAEAFDIEGTLRVEDLINNLPQAFAAQGANLANGSTGTASINLRGLGASRTLTLMNGRRMPYGSVNVYAPDVNFIPAALVKQVDVLTGGASATYGADAVAGVVNFILDDEFEGFRIDANGSFFQHNNDNDIQSLLEEFAAGNPDQYAVPNGSTTGGGAFDITAIWGGSFDGGKGSFQAYAGYQHVEELLQADYDYSQCALGTRNDGTEFTCAGSSTNQFSNLLELDSGYAFPNGSVWARVDPAAGEFVDRNFVSDTFNFNPFNHFQRPNERYSAGFFVNYEVNDKLEVYSEFQFMDNRTNSQIAPSGVFGLGVSGSNGGINCDNPFLSAQQVDFLCGEIADGALDTDDDGNPVFDMMPDRAALAADGVAPVLILRRNVEGGERNQDIRHTTFRGTIGARGQIGDSAFDYDIYAMYSNTHRIDVYNNDLSIQNIQRALYAVDDGNGGVACRVNVDDDPSNNDPNCVPYDIFSGAAPDPAAVNYIVSPLNRDGDTKQWVLSALVTGDLTEYGFKSPYSTDGAAVAFGIEYREDFVESNPDRGFQTGDGAGQGGPTNPIQGRVDVLDVFAELNLPLMQGQPWAEILGVDAAYRFSSYENFETNSYKFGADWAPTTDVRFRGSYQRAVRAPNIFDLFTVQGIGLFDLSVGSNGIFDPCAGTTPAATAAQCANTGVTAAQYGNIADNPAGQFNNLTGGNPDLDPETSDTFTIGAVITPSFLPGLTVSLDYFDITVEDFIDTVPEELALNNCLNTGDDFFCSLVNRGNGGTLWANQTGFITATNVNTGELATSGLDVNASYEMELGEGLGDLRFNFVGTWLEKLEITPLPGEDSFDCAGFYGGQCTTIERPAAPEWRHQFRTTWTTPIDLSLNATWRFVDGVEAFGANVAPINSELDSQNYLDVSAIYPVNDMITLRAGINNILDNDPPLSSIVGTAPGNGNTFPQIYDSFGRFVFFGAQIDF